MTKWNINHTALLVDRRTLGELRDDYGIRRAYETDEEANGRPYHPIHRQSFSYTRHPHLRYVIGELANLTIPK